MKFCKNVEPKKATERMKLLIIKRKGLEFINTKLK